ncbi:hypothetical protein MPRG_12960 [Mycobacterium paragordonae]|uniref:Uncharacterized protein n=1 Tax=Mycobacterium paragordonae TaxID=1389713 RepID=A0ABQ1C133_9MYCO|nr:hypothetical protein MPRG_12960 [Mycobacterium paragordonae]
MDDDGFAIGAFVVVRFDPRALHVLVYEQPDLSFSAYPRQEPLVASIEFRIQVQSHALPY